MPETHTSTRDMSTPPATGHTLAGKYLTFTLASEEYGLPVLGVREIIKMLDVTPVPHAPAHVKGVVNLRGKVIPVVDLRVRFGLQARPSDDRTCIIVIGVKGRQGRTMLGVVVDAVSEVLTVVAEDIEETPAFGARVNTEFIEGVAKVKSRVMFMLNLDEILVAETGRP